jgi:hypothetical protein
VNSVTGNHLGQHAHGGADLRLAAFVVDQPARSSSRIACSSGARAPFTLRWAIPQDHV